MIIHVISGLNVGGAELMLKRLVVFGDRGVDSEHKVISLTEIGTVGKHLQALGVGVEALGLRSVLDIPLVIWRLVRLIRSCQPDVVQTWMYHADMLGGIAARLAGNRSVIWGIRTTDVTAGGTAATTFVRWLCAKLSHIVPHTIVCAAEESRKAHIALGYDASRMVVVPNGFELSQLTATPAQRIELRRQCGLDRETVVVGYLGRFHPAKDQENFVRAAGLVSKQDDTTKFLMVGRNLDVDNKQLVRWIADTGCPDRFILLGERSDVPACLAAMDIFCISSRTEGFPNVVGEAMAMGLPCVVTDVGDAAMLVGNCGKVVPKEDSVALADGLMQMLAMSLEARLSMGEEAKARIRAEFSMERARERFEAIYQRVAGKAGS